MNYELEFRRDQSRCTFFRPLPALDRVEGPFEGPYFRFRRPWPGRWHH